MRLLACLAAIICFAAVLVLPGAGVNWLVRRIRVRPGRGDDRIEASLGTEFCMAAGSSLLLVTALGYSLLALHLFAAGTLALCVLPLASVGLIPTCSLIMRLVRRWRAVIPLLAVAAPFAYPALLPGHVPQNNFNWFYWDLGKALSAVHGIPHYVMEYGQPVRWQPDYLSFNVVAEAYRGMMVGSSDGTAIDAFKVPVALFVVGLTWLALRLWFSSAASFVGLVLLGASHLYATKLGNARPEVLGFGVGLVAVILGVRALRARLWSHYVLAAAVLAVDSSVHAIGALMAALLLAAATVVAFVHGPARGWISRTVLSSGVLLACVIAGTGWALQGRAFVGIDASHPQLQGGTDPTLVYFELTEGTPAHQNFVHLLGLRLRNVFRTWDIGVVAGWVLVASLAACLIFTIAINGSRAREGAVIAACLGACLAAGTAWFALRYTTFVPQNTGLSRFVQWSPLVYALVFIAALDAVGMWLLTRSRIWPRVSARGLVALPVLTALGIAAGLLVETQAVSLTPIDTVHQRAIDELSHLVHPGDVVLSNANTHGLFEYFTNAEAPLEGRQPVIEQPAILEATNDYLRRVIAYFADPSSTDPATAFNASWVVTTTRAAGFGATDSLGSRAPRIPTGNGVALVWHSDGTSIYHVAGGHPVRRTGPPETVWRRWFAVLATLLLLAELARRMDRRAAARTDDGRETAGSGKEPRTVATAPTRETAG